MDFSEITSDLFIGTTPAAADYDLLRSLGVRLVINMRFLTRLEPDSHQPPLNLLWLRTIDSPFSPIPLRKLLEGTQVAIETIRQGGKVYSHCAKGRHRSVAMGAAILIAQGHGPEAANGRSPTPACITSAIGFSTLRGSGRFSPKNSARAEA
jgi:hypothetical protein